MQSMSAKLLHSKVVPWILLVSWMGIIYLLSSQPYSGQATGSVLGQCNVPVRKFAHMSEFGVLFLFAKWSLNTTPWKRYSVVAFLFSVIYATLDEWHQAFVPGRSASISDVGLDALGALVAWIMFFLLVPTRNADKQTEDA